MKVHRYVNLQYAVFEYVDYVVGNSRIKDAWHTIFYEDIVWC